MQAKRFIVFLCNILITIACALSICAYFVLPLWKVELSYNVNAQMLQELVGAENSEEMDFEEILGEEGVTLSLGFEIQTKDVLSSLNSDPTVAVSNLIDGTVDSVVEQLWGTLNQITQGAVSELSKEMVKQSVKQSVADIFADSGNQKSDQELQAILNEVGFSDEYIENKTDELLDSLYADGATVGSVADKVTEIVEDVYQKLDNSDYAEFDGAALSPEDKEQLNEDIQEALASILCADEDGNINMDDMTAQLLLELLNSQNTAAVDQASEMRVGYAQRVGATYAEESQEDVNEQLKQQVRDAIMQQIPEDAAQGIAQGMKYVSYALLFTFFTWAYLVIKIVFKFFSKDNSIKVKLPILLGWLPFLVLQGIPTLVMWLFKSSPAFLTDALGAETVAQITAALNPLSVTFSSAAVVSFAAAAALAVFVLFFYGGMRKSLKRTIREER